LVDAEDTDNSATVLEQQSRIVQDSFRRPIAYLSETCGDAIGGESSLHLAAGAHLDVTKPTSPPANVARRMNDAKKIASRSLPSQIRKILDPTGQAFQNGVRVRRPPENNRNRQYIAGEAKTNGNDGAMDVHVALPASISGQICAAGTTANSPGKAVTYSLSSQLSTEHHSLAASSMSTSESHRRLPMSDAAIQDQGVYTCHTHASHARPSASSIGPF
jgi:hypothetical protein